MVKVSHVLLCTFVLFSLQAYLQVGRSCSPVATALTMSSTYIMSFIFVFILCLFFPFECCQHDSFPSLLLYLLVGITMGY